MKYPLAEAQELQQSGSQTFGGFDRNGFLLASSKPMFGTLSMEVEAVHVNKWHTYVGYVSAFTQGNDLPWNA